jgi:nitroreductase
MKKPVDSSVPLHPLINERWSPRSFDNSCMISDEDFTAILEAGRWAPSAFNAQPWRFVVAKRGNENFERMAKTFSGFNAKWAPTASAFILVAALKTKADGAVNSTAEYDCGQAAAFMTFEATHRGFAIHQIEGFDKDQVKKDFALAENLAPMAILIIGKQAPVESLTDATLVEREKAPRVRLPLSEIIVGGDQ